MFKTEIILKFSTKINFHKSTEKYLTHGKNVFQKIEFLRAHYNTKIYQNTVSN